MILIRGYIETNICLNIKYFFKRFIELSFMFLNNYGCPVLVIGRVVVDYWLSVLPSNG